MDRKVLRHRNFFFLKSDIIYFFTLMSKWKWWMSVYVGALNCCKWWGRLFVLGSLVCLTELQFKKFTWWFLSFFLSFLLMIFFVSMILGLMDGEAVSLFFLSFLLFSLGDSIFKVGYWCWSRNVSSQGSLERVWGFVLFWGKFFFWVLGNVNVFNVKLEDKQSMISRSLTFFHSHISWVI